MLLFHVRGPLGTGKGGVRGILLFFALAIVLSGCFGDSEGRKGKDALRILLDTSPATLNPRSTLDAAGQRLNALMFRGLTRVDADLNAIPDLASGWTVRDGGRTWIFDLKPGELDHSDRPINAVSMRQCLENYRTGKPVSPLRGAFPNWESTDTKGDSVILHLKAPDPYLSRNLSLLRFFRTEGTEEACAEPKIDQSVIASGAYKPKKWNLSPESVLTLLPMKGAASRIPIEFHFIHDENTKATKLLSGEVDVIQNALALTKTRWIEKNYSDRFDILSRDGVSVSYLAFNFKDATLSRPEVRRAIALAIDRDSVVKHKLFGYCKKAGSFLSPHLPESLQSEYAFDPAGAEKILETAGFSRDREGVRLRLRYKSTPTREGIETALLFKEMLGKVGIQLTIDVVEPAVFYASIKKGNFQLYSSRWLGVSDGSILYTSLHTGQPMNRISYSDPEMDKLLERAVSEPDFKKRLPLLHEAQRKMALDLPYFPLWYWDTAVIIRKGLTGLSEKDVSLSGGLEPLTHLRYQ